MNTTIDRTKRIRLPAILLISAGVQLAVVLVLLAFPALHTTRLTADPEDPVAADERARERRREHEERRREARQEARLTEEEAEPIVEQEARAAEQDIRETLFDMKAIRDTLDEAEAILLDALEERSLRDLSLDWFDRLHPLATQLVANALAQRDGLGVAGTTETAGRAEAFLYTLRAVRPRLLEPGAFDELRAAHEQTRAAQEIVIRALDAAQQAYPEDRTRIDRENHVEYLVNLMRDRISEILWALDDFDAAALNDPPADYRRPAPLPEDWAAGLDAMDVEDLVTEGQALYNDIAALFTAARAADLAMTDALPLAQGFDRVDLPPPPSGFTPGSTDGLPGTIGELNALRDNLGQAARDVQGQWRRAHAMGQAGRAMAGLPPSPGGRDGAAPGTTPGGRGPAGTAATGGAGRGARNAAAPGQRYADLTGFTVYRGPGEQGYGGAPGGGRDVTHTAARTGYRESGAAEAAAAAAEPALSEDEVIAQALPGRKFSRASPRTGWMYIDTWYVIGPWENRHRLGFEQTWPPETLIDLDAEYTGKDGRTVSWRFHQSDNIRVKPPFESESSTYYAYTEIYFEEATDMTVAIASDDAARVWLNGRLIWEDNGLSPWRIDEGFRKVRFREGFNTVLVRVENGPITCTWSLLLCPPDAARSEG